MVVSSVTPRQSAATRVQRCGSFVSSRASSRRTTANSSLSAGRGAGHLAGLLELHALVDAAGWRRRRRPRSGSGRARRRSRGRARCSPSTPRASRPSRRRPARRAAPRRCRPGPPPPRRRRGPGSRRCCSEAQRTSAPSSRRVSMSTAVWMVMCSEPVMRWPAQRLLRARTPAHRHEAGHLLLGELDLLAAPLGQGEVLHLVLDGRRRWRSFARRSGRPALRRFGFAGLGVRGSG